MRCVASGIRSSIASAAARSMVASAERGDPMGRASSTASREMNVVNCCKQAAGDWLATGLSLPTSRRAAMTGAARTIRCRCSISLAAAVCRRIKSAVYDAGRPTATSIAKAKLAIVRRLCCKSSTLSFVGPRNPISWAIRHQGSCKAAHQPIRQANRSTMPALLASKIGPTFKPSADVAAATAIPIEA
jgi:hypothetical protein